MTQVDMTFLPSLWGKEISKAFDKSMLGQMIASSMWFINVPMDEKLRIKGENTMHYQACTYE